MKFTGLVPDEVITNGVVLLLQFMNGLQTTPIKWEPCTQTKAQQTDAETDEQTINC